MAEVGLAQQQEVGQDRFCSGSAQNLLKLSVDAPGWCVLRDEEFDVEFGRCQKSLQGVVESEDEEEY